MTIIVGSGVFRIGGQAQISSRGAAPTLWLPGLLPRDAAFAAQKERAAGDRREGASTDRGSDKRNREPVRDVTGVVNCVAGSSRSLISSEKLFMENALESFARLEKRTLALGQRYQEVLEERERLQQVVEKQAQSLAELEAEVSRQKDMFTAIDAKMVELLQQIDNYLPEESPNPGSEQVLPGMHAS